MIINEFDINENVSVSCVVGEISIADSYDAIGYLKVAGTYKFGSAGRPDAEHIVGMTAYAQARFYCEKWLLDFSELNYKWGDEMDWVLSFGGGDEIVALVIGDDCIEAISTLLDPNASPRDCLRQADYFESIEKAYSYLLEHP